MTKNYGLLGIMLLLLGIAVGWFTRGASDSAAEESKLAREASSPKMAVSAKAAEPDAEKPAVVQGKRAIRENTPKKPEGGVKIMQPDSEEMKAMRKQMGKAMADRQRAKFQQRIDKLAEALSLTDAQKANLATWLDERVAKLESLDPLELANDNGLTQSLTPKGLEDHLAASLTSEQKTELAGLKERETQSKVDSMALKSLAQMQGVFDFEEGQRDEVYKILTESAQERLQRQNEKPDQHAMFVDGMGIEMDPYDLGIQDAMREAFSDMGDSGGAVDQESMQKKMRDVIDQRINEKVEKLRPVLNDKQLEQYRTELKNKGGGMLGGGIMGASSIQIHSN